MQTIVNFWASLDASYQNIFITIVPFLAWAAVLFWTLKWGPVFSINSAPEHGKKNRIAGQETRHEAAHTPLITILTRTAEKLARDGRADEAINAVAVAIAKERPENCKSKEPDPWLQ